MEQGDIPTDDRRIMLDGGSKGRTERHWIKAFEVAKDQQLIEKSVDNILNYSHREFLRRTLTSRCNLRKVMYSLMEKEDDSELTEREMHSIAMIMNLLMESRSTICIHSFVRSTICIHSFVRSTICIHSFVRSPMYS